jgi:hypothetical protein
MTQSIAVKTQINLPEEFPFISSTEISDPTPLIKDPLIFHLVDLIEKEAFLDVAVTRGSSRAVSPLIPKSP